MSVPSRGEVWRVDLEPVRGHEQGRVRPALILSSNVINHESSGLVTVVPMTAKGRALRSFLKIEAPEGGVPKPSYIICDQIRTISAERLGRRFGTVSAKTLAEVERRVRFLLDLR